MENQISNGNDQTAVDQAAQMNQATEAAATATPEILLNEQPIIDWDTLRGEQNYLRGTLGALGAALVGAFLWAVITVATGYQIGYMALAIGLLVGFTNRYLGKGIDLKFGITGALLALLGCLLGNVFSLIGFVAKESGLGYFEAFGFIDFSLIPDAMLEAFSPVDLLFYGIAMYEGFKFSFRITETATEENA